MNGNKGHRRFEPVFSDSELLARIDERTQKTERDIANHLYHHWMVALAAIAAAMTSAGALAVFVFTWWLKRGGM